MEKSEKIFIGLLCLFVVSFGIIYSVTTNSGAFLKREALITIPPLVSSSPPVSVQEQHTRKSLQPLNLNTATLDELTYLFDSAILAERVLEMREKIGGFRSVEELLMVDGISENMLLGLLEPTPCIFVN